MKNGPLTLGALRGRLDNLSLDGQPADDETLVIVAERSSWDGDGDVPARLVTGGRVGWQCDDIERTADDDGKVWLSYNEPRRVRTVTLIVD